MENKQKNIPKLRFPQFKDEWERKQIENLFDFKNGLNKEKEYFGRGIPIINFTDVYHLNTIKKSDIKGLVDLSEKEIINYSAKKGDVFFTRTSETIKDIGMSATLIEDIDNCVFSGFVLRARPKNSKILDNFKSYCFNIFSVRKEIVIKSSFTTRALTSGTLLNKVWFSYPKHKEEQKKIASFLTAVDKKIELLQQKKQHWQDYKKAFMQKLFSQELRFKDEKGNEFLEWEIKKMSQIGNIITGSTPSTTQKEYYEGEYLFVSPADIGNDRYITNTKTTLTKLGLEQGRLIKKDSILFVCIGSTIGKLAQINQDGITNQQINSIVVYENYDTNFIYSLLEYNSIKIKLLAATQAVPIINKTTFSKIELRVPKSIKEQKKIANFLSALDKKIELVGKQIQYSEQFKTYLLQNLFV